MFVAILILARSKRLSNILAILYTLSLQCLLRLLFLQCYLLLVCCNVLLHLVVDMTWRAVRSTVIATAVRSACLG